MIEGLKTRWKAFRSHFWGSLALDVVLIITGFLLISMWQTRNLPDDDHTPPLELAWLDDMKADSVLVPGQVGVVYFFAPWCFYCRSSIDNLNELVSSGKLAWARVVALEYESLDEVREFIDETGVHLPVLLGTGKLPVIGRSVVFPPILLLMVTGRLLVVRWGIQPRLVCRRVCG